MTLAVLLYYFVSTCNPDSDLCSRYTEAPRWPGFVEVGAAYDVDGPFLTPEDCEAERGHKHVAVETALGAVVMNPWGDGTQSLCYAREIRVTIP